MFEDKTFSRVQEDILARFPDDIDTREGSVAQIITGPNAWEIAGVYQGLDQVERLVMLATAPGEYLDSWGWTTGIARHPASSAIYNVVFEGAEPALGARFFTDGKYFLVVRTDDDTLALEAEVPGTEMNDIIPGTPAVPVRTIKGLKSAAFGMIYEPGTDEEEDEPYRERIHDKLAGPAANGNRMHYKMWCESVLGVGRARIIPLFAGENTVLAVLYDPEGRPCAQPVVNRVQEYVDPITVGWTAEYEGRTVTLGDGCGDGVANIGAHFAAIAADTVPVTVEFTACVRDGYTMREVREQANEALDAYFSQIALAGLDDSNIVVRLTTIGAALANMESLVDYDGLTLNGAAKNVTVPLLGSPVLAEVIVNEAV